MKAYLAGGCFWCMEKPYHTIEGVRAVTSGYCGGDEADAVYESVKAQQTMHRETVCIDYDETQISFAELLEVYLGSIDPFDEGGQFIDRGRSYTCAVYCTDAEQERVTRERLARIEREYGQAAAVAVEPFRAFYPAEEYHQNYAEKNPEAYAREFEDSGRRAFRESKEKTDREE